MKQCRDIGALRAFARLRAAEFNNLTTYLRESRDEELESLKRARNLDDMARSQSAIDVIEQVLKYVAEGETLATKYQK
jgi:hypothetical protein